MKQINTNIKLIWAILCQESSIDSNTNNVSLFKIVEEITFEVKKENLDRLQNDPEFDPKKPIVFPFSSQLVILWKNLSKKTTLNFLVKITLRDPDQKVLREISNSFLFQDGKERLRTTISLNGLPISKPGEYIYSISTKQTNTSNFKEIASIPLKINMDLRSIPNK